MPRKPITTLKSVFRQVPRVLELERNLAGTSGSKVPHRFRYSSKHLNLIVSFIYVLLVPSGGMRGSK